MKWLVYLIIYFIPWMVTGQKQIIHATFQHLRDGARQEWSSFPLHAKDSRFLIQFRAGNNLEETCLGITQTDVNHLWKVILNEKELGSLVTDEKKMVTYFSVPPGLLKEDHNILIIRPVAMNTDQPDDVFVGNIVLFHSSKNNLLTQSHINIHTGIPSRITILNEQGALQPVYALPGDTLAIRSGVIYSGTGNFSFSLPAGRYKLYGSRGFEYGVDSLSINIGAAQSLSRRLTIPHEVDMKDWVSCDTHVHTLEYSGHGDASMKERVITIAGEGLDYAVITEHNKIVNINDTINKMAMKKWFTPITGDELTTKVGHFNIFPISRHDAIPSPDVSSWNEVKQRLSGYLDKKVVILNHSRDMHSGFRPSDFLTVAEAGQLPANAMEVMNSGSQQTDPEQLYLDWMALMNRGIFLTPVGSSDSHDVSRFIVGQARTYVRRDGDFISNFINGRVGVSFGIFTELKVDSSSKNGKINVTINIYAPSWVKPGKIYLYANGKKIFYSRIKAKRGGGLVAHYRVPVSKGNKMVLVAVAEGADPGVPWWPIAKPYQHTSPAFSPIVLGVSGPVKIAW